MFKLKQILEAANKALKNEGHKLTIEKTPGHRGYFSICEGNMVLAHTYKHASPTTMLYNVSNAVIGIIKQGCLDFNVGTWESVNLNDEKFFISIWTKPISADLAWIVSLEGETVKVVEKRVTKIIRGTNFTIVNNEEMAVKEWKMSVEEYFEALVGMLLLVKQTSRRANQDADDEDTA